MSAALLSLATFGVYFLVLLWKWSAWRDGWDPRGRSLVWAKWGIWLSVSSALAIIIGYATFFGLMFAGMGDEEPGTMFFGMFIGFFALVLLGSAAILAGRICLFVAQWKVWTSLQDALAWRGMPPKVTPIALLMIEIFGPQVMYVGALVVVMVLMLGVAGTTVLWGPELGVAGFAAIGGAYLLAGIAVVLPILYVIKETQARVLELVRPGDAPFGLSTPSRSAAP